MAGLTSGGDNYSGLAGPTSINCDVKPPFLTQVKVQGGCPLPGSLDVAVVFQSVPGVPITANYAARSTQVAPFLGRNLVRPGELYGDRIH